jgi:peroxiredoxin
VPASPERSLSRALALPRSEAGTRRLIGMLQPSSRDFQGLSGADAEWLRGQLLAALAERRIPDLAVPLIVEDLRTSASPVVVAGAARAIRKCGIGDGAKRELIERAKARIAGRDEFVAFGAGGPPAALTARQELDSALAPAAEERPCCGGGGRPSPTGVVGGAAAGEAFARAEIQDQDGRRTSLAELAGKRHSLLALFYTRCMNPEKCSATVTSLGRLARRFEAEPGAPDLQIIGLSYDGAYDLPRRLKDYGTDRSFAFGDRAFLARCTRGWPGLRRLLDLQVGYGDATVNYHEREIFLIEPGFAIRRLPPESLSEPAQLLAWLEVDRTQKPPKKQLRRYGRLP